MGKAEDRLASQLEEAENKIYKLEEQIKNEEDNQRWKWARHTEIPKEQKQVLPVPRLEIWYDSEEDDGYNRIWIYRMIYRHFLGHCVAVPFGCTKQSGGNFDIEAEGLMTYLPFRDGAHIRHDAKAFNMPAYIVYKDLVEPISPLTNL